MNSNIILIGMPGSGKTTVGSQLAERFNFSFRDSDDDIKEETNCDVSDWLTGLGDEKFLCFESKKIQEYYKDMTDSVLSTGGSVALVDESVHFLRQKGKIILLDISLELIQKRLPEMRIDRIVGMNGKTPRFTSFQELYNFRREKYLKAAHHIIDTRQDGFDIVGKIQTLLTSA